VAIAIAMQIVSFLFRHFAKNLQCSELTGKRARRADSEGHYIWAGRA
jgi:hypothetical protein